MKTITCDVLVVGGGCAGVCASLSAAKNGAKTILIEKAAYLGGALTQSGVSPLSSLYANDKKIIYGLVDEIIGNVKKSGYEARDVGGNLYPISFACEKEGLKETFEKMCLDYGVNLMYQTSFVESYVENGHINSCVVQNKEGLLKINAKVFIDASGDAVLASNSGIECVYGDGKGHTQSMTTIVYVSNVDNDAIEAYMNSNNNTRCWKSNERWVLCDFEEKLIEARKNGKLKFYNRKYINAFESAKKGEYVINMSIVNCKNILDENLLSKAEEEGKKQAEEIVEFFKEYIPGFKNCHVDSMGDSIGIRETNKIKGVYCINENDLINNVMFYDAIAMGAYPIDLHNSKSGLIDRASLKKGSWYSIPYRSLITNEINNLIVTGRCLSSTQLANSAIRVSFILMAISEAAGTAAALSVKEKVDVNKLNTDKLRTKLKDDGVFLEEYKEGNMNETLLTCKGICKNFGITKALDDVDFSLERGCIHGLIGENGSGKSTLSNIISAIYHKDSGTMTLNGNDWNPSNTLEAIKGGVAIIVQEAGTIPNITVAQNIFIGRYDQFKKNGFIDKKALNKKADEILESIGVTNIKGSMPARNLNLQQRKIVEIAKALSNDIDILIADETTNVLSEEGRKILFDVIEKLKKQNKSIIIISHDIEEVVAHCDKITILRDGKITATLPSNEFEVNKIKSLMIGREIATDFYRKDDEGYQDEVVLRLENASSLTDVTNLSLDLHKGEILGIGGLADSGMHVVGKMLFGAERLARGSVSYKGIKYTSPSKAVDLGIAYISKDRDTESLATNTSINNNIAATGLEQNKIANVIYSKLKEKKYVLDEYNSLKIKANSRFDKVNSLSGGNKQKVAFAKWFAKKCDVFIMDCPTRGIDIGIKQEIYAMMCQMKKEGKSIVLIGEEMPELIGMSDRLIVMKNGRIAKEFYRKDGLSEEKIIDYMF